MKKGWIASLLAQLPGARTDVSMADYTTFRIGGPADLFYEPDSEAALSMALMASHAQEVPVTIIGNGSNVLVRDGGIRGIVLMIGRRLARIASIDETTLAVEAGASLAKVARVAQAAGLSGLEALSGIPGTVGGACVMNAGAYGAQIADVLVAARLMHPIRATCASYPANELAFGYRTSRPHTTGEIVTHVTLRLVRDDPDEIAARMNDYAQRRRDKQPLCLPSAGSTFKRPEGHFAGALIEQCGLKGLQIGGARVSDKHAGFIVNVDRATAADVLRLITTVQTRVDQQFHVQLVPEVRVIGDPL